MLNVVMAAPRAISTPAVYIHPRGLSLLKLRLVVRCLFVLTRLAAQAQHLASLSWSCHRPVELMCNADSPLHQLGVAYGFASAGKIDVVFQANSNMAAHQGGERGQGELKRTDC